MLRGMRSCLKLMALSARVPAAAATVLACAALSSTLRANPLAGR